MKKHNNVLVPLAKTLRKNLTKEEKRLWYDFLNKYPIKFVRQKPIGPYIVDFYCAKAKLVIELDGSQHYFEKELSHDEERTKFLNEEFGISVLRFSNLDILNNFNGVCQKISEVIDQSLSHLRWQLPSSKGASYR